MDRTEALVLAGKIETTWFGRLHSAQLDAWIDALCELDSGAAGTAFARLRGRVDKLTISAFMAETRSIRTHDGSKPREHCEACDNTGWLEADPYIDPDRRNHNGDPIAYTQVRPCGCREGAARANSSIWTENHPTRHRDAA